MKRKQKKSWCAPNPSQPNPQWRTRFFFWANFKDHFLSGTSTHRSRLHYAAFHFWIYLAVWHFLSVDEGQTLEAVAQRLSITRAQTSEILRFLKDAPLCSDEDGVYKMRSQHIHLEFGSTFLARHHSNWSVKFLQRIDDITEEEIMFTSPFSVSKKDFLRIREEIVKLIKYVVTVFLY